MKPREAQLKIDFSAGPRIIKDMKKSILLIFILFSFNSLAKVHYFNQWHLLPGVDTTKVQSPKIFPQYENQLKIYDKVSKLVKDKKVKTLIIEGCEGEIKKGFNEKFNGWTLESLNLYMSNKLKTTAEFRENVLTHLGIKLKAYFKHELNVVCGDNAKLIKEHQLAFSDLNGYLGFYSRLKQNKNNKKRFDTYAKAMLDGKKILIDDPIQYAKEGAQTALTQVKSYINKRNDKILEVIKKYPKNTAIILGAAHFDDLSKKLKASKITFVNELKVESDKSPHQLLAQIEALLK